MGFSGVLAGAESPLTVEYFSSSPFYPFLPTTLTLSAEACMAAAMEEEEADSTGMNTLMLQYQHALKCLSARTSSTS